MSSDYNIFVNRFTSATRNAGPQKIDIQPSRPGIDDITNLAATILGKKLAGLTRTQLHNVCKNADTGSPDVALDETVQLSHNVPEVVLLITHHRFATMVTGTSLDLMQTFFDRIAPLQYSSGSSCRLSTIHSSKGLEAPRVILLVAGRSPMYEQTTAQTTISESICQNLLYVGLTRGRSDAFVFLLSEADHPTHFLGLPVACVPS